MNKRAMPVIVAMKRRAWRMPRLLRLVPGLTEAGLRLVDGSIRAAGDWRTFGSDSSERAWACADSAGWLDERQGAPTSAYQSDREPPTTCSSGPKR